MKLICVSKLWQVTLRHLGTVQAILATAAAASPEGKVDADVINLVNYAEEATIRFYGTLSVGELALLRQTLARCAPGMFQRPQLADPAGTASLRRIHNLCLTGWNSSSSSPVLLPALHPPTAAAEWCCRLPLPAGSSRTSA
jgi:hypothetical protein